MPAPVNANELLDLVKKSGVVDELKLDAYVKKLNNRSKLPADPARLAGLLIHDAILTQFQAEQLLQGKYKRFFIGKYKVLEKLGAGGMGQVFLCEHKLMRRRVAVKVLPTAKAEDPSSLERFYREARAVAAVDHPNIVRAYDIDQDENLHFLVMEYVDGRNLQDLIKMFGPLDPVRACHYMYGASVGLQHAHEIGLVHRDIKPGNILIDRAGVVKILDMGLARFFHDEDDVLTKKYDENVLGTADYLAPEQALDSHSVDIRADIYSLGATFYYLLTGSPPFPEGSVAQKLIWHQNRHPRHIRSLRPDTPDEVTAIVDRMMMKDAAKRFQQPADVIAALARWVATPIPPPSEKEMPVVSPAAGGVRAPATMIGSSRANSAGDAPTVIAPGASPVMTPPPLLSLDDANTPAPVVWETLDADTQPLARSDTDRTAPDQKAQPTWEDSDSKRKRLWIAIAAGVCGLLVLLGLYFAFFHKSTPRPDPNATQNRVHRIVVSRTAGENAVGTLRDALSKANPGDTIVIAEPKLTESKLTLDRTKHRDLTIETADGKPVVVEASGTLGTMFEARDVEGLKLKNIEFDGKGQVEYGVVVSGTTPGTIIEGVTVRGIKSAGFKLSNAAGDSARPIVLDRCRVLLTSPAQTAFWLFAAGADTRSVTLRNFRAEGTNTGTGIRIEGACTDLVVSGGRFFSLDEAIAFGKPPTGKTAKGRITSNTIYQAKTGLEFQMTPPEPPAGRFDMTIDRNYFVKTQAIAKSPTGAVPVITLANNAHGPETGQGSFPIPVWTLNTPVLSALDPANDSTFLRFPGGPPEIPPNKAKVGAP